jgi:hypothetical protein
MTPSFLPLIVDAPACDRPRASDALSDPTIVHLVDEAGREYFVPLSLAAVQALVVMLAGPGEAEGRPE